MKLPQAPRELLTERLRLRAFGLADHPRYAQINADPEVMRFIGTGGPVSPEACWRSLAVILGHWQLLGYGFWAVTLRGSGELVGHAGFIDPPGWPGFELGWLLAREHWGHGYAQEAAQAALQVAFGTLMKPRVISLIRPANERSVALAQRLGAREEASIDFLGGPARVFAHAR